MRSLFIVEPWICHYEVFPSIIESANAKYEKIVIYVQTPKHLMENYKQLPASLSHISFKELNLFLEDARTVADTSEVDIWVNTSHIHGSAKSFNEYQCIYRSITSATFDGKIFIVIHNKHDLEFFNELSKDKTENVFPVCLSQDTMYKFLLNHKKAKLFEPFTLNFGDRNLDNKIIYGQNPDAINLLIIGMCREGKKFRELQNFVKYIRAEQVTFSFCGWTPPGTIKQSGLFFAINNGLINNLECSKLRVKDSIINDMIIASDALIDLKSIDKANSYVSSGNISASISMEKPLIAHQKNYPSFNCIRYDTYMTLTGMLNNIEQFKDTLAFHKFLLKKEKNDRSKKCAEIFEHSKQ